MKLDADVIVVGAGISGIGAGIELARRGYSFIVLEAHKALGGTWRDNAYPGVAVDIPSISYCYSFETGYRWSRKFAEGHEILAYVEHCAAKYGVREHIRFDARVRRCAFVAEHDAFTVELDNGDTLAARYIIAATGLLSQPKLPDIPGRDTFVGASMHTARWDPAFKLRGKRVAVIGTGASSVQLVPELAEQVAQLTVFQRTPIWVSPKDDAPLSPGSSLSARSIAPLRAALRWLSELNLEVLTFAVVNYRSIPLLVDVVQRFTRAAMRRQLGDRADLVDKLVPRYRLGCKRPTISNVYLRTFRRDNVALVTAGIRNICPAGVETDDGVVHEADAIIFATGFLTTEKGNAPSFEVVGNDRLELGQFWDSHRLQAYAGVSVPGFPNFFLTAGPYAGGLNWFTMLESHLRHIGRCLDRARALGATRVEVTRDAHDDYMRAMWRRADGTVFKNSGCAGSRSYYLDRHGDASLPLPHTPWWRALRSRFAGTRAYRFGSGAR